jgi:hypothetical protein
MSAFGLASLVLIVLVASTSVAADDAVSDPSTWRWTVAAALDQQRASDEAGQARLAAVKFRQNYERYSAVGVLETSR